MHAARNAPAVPLRDLLDAGRREKVVGVAEVHHADREVVGIDVDLVRV
jgi:hypothetical protein